MMRMHIILLKQPDRRDSRRSRRRALFRIFQRNSAQRPDRHRRLRCFCAMANPPQLLQSFAIRRSALLKHRPKHGKACAMRLALATSAAECVETPITGSLLPARAKIDRTSLANKSFAGRCTPCAPQASATSVRELMSSCVREPPSAAIAFSAKSSSARLSRSFSRSCIYSTPAAAHSAIFASSRCSCSWRSPANCRRSVM